MLTGFACPFWEAKQKSAILPGIESTKNPVTDQQVILSHIRPPK